MSVWDGILPSPPLGTVEAKKYTSWDAPQEPMSAEEYAQIRASMLAPPVYRAPLVRASLYYAHRRRWLAHLFSTALGFRSQCPPFGCVA